METSVSPMNASRSATLSNFTVSCPFARMRPKSRDGMRFSPTTASPVNVAAGFDRHARGGDQLSTAHKQVSIHRRRHACA